MRKYLFIDLHIHSIHSNETDCDSTPEDILYNAMQTAKKIQSSMIERIESVEQEYADNAQLLDKKINELVKEFAPYFADSEQDQQNIIQQLLISSGKIDQLKQYILNDTQCTISITDHQNIEGSKEAIKLIKSDPKKYKMINFVSGIEVNAGLRCMGINDEGYSSFKKCHALAYGYDVFDPTFNVYSKLYNFELRNTNYSSNAKKSAKFISIGKMVLFAKKKVDELTGDTLQIKELDFILNAKSCQEAKKMFFDYVKTKYPKIDFSRSAEVSNCFDFTPKGNESAIAGSKWELDEYMQAIKEAGGQFSLAHPYSIKRKRTAKDIKKLNNEFVDALIETTHDSSFLALKSLSSFDNSSLQTSIAAINARFNKRYSADEIYSLYVTMAFGKDIEEFVTKVINIRKDHDFGFEIFNKLNLRGAKSKVLFDLAKKYDLFLTAGSDHHGPHLHVENLISRCFDKKFIYSGDDLFELADENLQTKIQDVQRVSIDNTITSMPFIGFVKNKYNAKERQKISFYNRQNGTIDFSNNLFDRHKTWIVEPNYTVESIKNHLSIQGIDHIARKDFQFFINNEIKKENTNCKTPEKKQEEKIY